MQHPDPRAFNIDGFCTAHSISRTTYYRLKKAGLGPDEMKALGKPLITVEAAQRWRQNMTLQSLRDHQGVGRP